jgi:hypothetical protein
VKPISTETDRHITKGKVPKALGEEAVGNISPNPFDLYLANFDFLHAGQDTRILFFRLRNQRTSRDKLQYFTLYTEFMLIMSL